MMMMMMMIRLQQKGRAYFLTNESFLAYKKCENENFHFQAKVYCTQLILQYNNNVIENALRLV